MRPLGIALLLVLCACTRPGGTLPTPTPEPPPPATSDVATPESPTPSAAPSDTASPSPSPVETPPPPAPAAAFDLVVSDIHLDNLDDSVITGAPGVPVVDAAGLAAVRRAEAVLEHYLNRAFLDPRTRFTAAPADDLLTLGALSRLTPAAKAGLGALNLDVRVSVPGPASAEARVLILGETVLQVALDYQAQLSVQLSDGRTGPVRQRGTLVFVTTPAGSRADFAEVHLTVPWDSSPSASHDAGARPAEAPPISGAES